LLAGRGPQELFGPPTLGDAAGKEKPDAANILKDVIAPKPVPPPPATVTATPEEPRTFTVRVLAGSHVTDVVLEARANSKEPNQSGQFDLWKINSPQPASGAAPNAGPPAMPPVVAAPVDQPAAGPTATADLKACDVKNNGSSTEKTDKKGD
jgi:hypothetical protein